MSTGHTRRSPFTFPGPLRRRARIEASSQGRSRARSPCTPSRDETFVSGSTCSSSSAGAVPNYVEAGECRVIRNHFVRLMVVHMMTGDHR